MSEGSVIPDNDVEEVDDSEVESSEVEEVKEESQETPETPETEEEEAKEEPQLTEDGTKLDPNPQSAVHQQLANLERRTKAYEAVLNDPNLYQEFASKLTGQPQVAQPQEITPESIQTVEDVVRVVNDLRKQTTTLEQQNRELQERLGQTTVKQFRDDVANGISQGTKLVRETYPELRKGDPSYNEKLEEQVSALYHELNYDPNLDGYTNRYPLEKVAERIMGTYNLTKQSASQEAQTIVKQKSMGKVVTSGKSNKGEPDYGDLTIAQRIALQYKRKK